MQLRRDVENAKNTNQALVQSNSQMQVEIDSMASHIKVVSAQNDELTREIDGFMNANEKIRQKLDRKSKVQHLQRQNELELLQSQKEMVRSRSPLRYEK